MRLFWHHSHLPETARGAVIAVGNFDGLHRGHQAVIEAAGGLAHAAGARLAVLTFEPHPRSVFRPDDPHFRLTPYRVKVRWLETLGVDFLYLIRFDAAFRDRSAESFVREVLIADLGARHVVSGWDFRFGRGRGGDLASLTAVGAAHGLGVTGVGPVADANGQVFSSTRIRVALLGGRPREAAVVLGRPWEIEGRVESGDRRGRTIGFPTANVELGDYLRPAFGVYAVRAGVDMGAATHWRDGVANLGRRPTVGGEVERLETHLFDFNDDLYGRHLRVQLIEFLRPERRFDGLEQLKAQIAQDCRLAKAALA